MKPFFKKTNGGSLYAFLKNDRVFHLKMNQYGKGEGFEFRVYKTRASFLKHDRLGGTGISFPEFQMLLRTAFAQYLEEITLLLPKELQEYKEDRYNLQEGKKQIQ